MHPDESDSITLKNLKATTSSWFSLGGQEAFERELNPGAAAGQVVGFLKIPSTMSLVISGNGRFAMKNNNLADSDMISL